jgi:hypothetical protein
MHSMKNIFYFLLFSYLSIQNSNAQQNKIHSTTNKEVNKDWLIDNANYIAQITTTDKQILIENGLVRRSFMLDLNLACIDYTNLTTGQQLLRSIEPEAVVVINNKSYSVGGLSGQKEKAYLNLDWEKNLHANDEDFYFTNYTVTSIDSFVNYNPQTWMPEAYGPNVKKFKGKQLILQFASKLPAFKGMIVKVHYNIYDGLPLLCKWVSIENGSQTIQLDRVVNEVLGLVEEESAVVGRPDEMKKQHGIYIETNYAFNNSMRYDISDHTTHWDIDSTYTSQVNYNYQTPCLLRVYPDKAPGIDLAPSASFASVRTFELLMDSYDRTRRGLMIKKMYRTVAPWVTQNPIFMHLVSKNDEEVKTAIDQCVATGFEAVILSFGSHLNMEDSSAQNINRWKVLADYAHQKHILLGGYSLFSSRTIGPEHDVIDAKTGKPGGAFFGNAPCFGSKWGLNYRDQIIRFYQQTNFDIWENDGPYPGDVCASTTHPGHKGLDDSQWTQMNIQKGLYQSLNKMGVYINAPDWYFLDGTHKIAVGYREVNFSLSREQQIILNRQNIVDGTKEKIPAMGWGFVPLTKYQGGGPEAVLEPLQDHIKDYQQLMVQYFGAGVQACYRGPRLFDTDLTKNMVRSTIDWYKKYRTILNADIISLRRADGRDWDGWMHVDPLGNDKGFVMLFNPSNTNITKTITIPMYYTGIKGTAKFLDSEGVVSNLNVNADHNIQISVNIPAGGYKWMLIR